VLDLQRGELGTFFGLASGLFGVAGGTVTGRITASAAPWAAASAAKSWPSLCRPIMATKRSPGPARRES